MEEQPASDEAVFEMARKLSDPLERDAFLQRACQSDPRLRRNVEGLLEAARDADDFFASGAAALQLPASGCEWQREQIGDWIGRYRLCKRIGEGGCGVVYAAEQEEPVRRMVALKIIKLGMDTQEVVARFDAERQALALMDHPSIAKVLDAGVTSAGRPYFVMELVPGTPITEFCDQNQATVPERLELFIDVCHAVQHAHHKAIIHRDLKPSNILVTLRDGVPMPKIIDFGIAKALEGRLTDLTIFTDRHEWMGTPAYMSPEQADMTSVDIDTRTDIYSLGVLLYQLLTGHTPFDTKELLPAGLDEIRRTIREKDPIRPSAKLLQTHGKRSSCGHSRASAPHSSLRIAHSVDPDLDWIVMKCLEKDRNRRYATANGLAIDIKRYLAHEPVLARPPSRFYRMAKTFQRHRITFSAAAAVALALIGGTAVSLREMIRARRAERDQVRLQRAQAEMLWNSYLAEAVALRTSPEAGRRFEALDRLQKAAMLRPELALRNAAIATFALPDLSLVRQVESSGYMYPDPTCRRYGCVLTSSMDGTVSVRSSENNRQLALLPGPGAPVVGGQFSPGGQLLALRHAMARDKFRYRIWDVERTQMVFQTRSPSFECLAFTPDSQRVILSGPSEPICVFDLRTGDLLHSFSAGTGVRVIALQPRDARLAILREKQSKVELWDLNSHSIVHPFEHPAPADNCLWSSDGQFLACSCEDSRIYVWDTETSRLQSTLIGHQSVAFPAAFSHDNEWLASTGWDGFLRLWSLHTGTEVCHLPTFGYCASFAPEDRALLVQSAVGKLGWFELNPGRERRTMRYSGPAGNECWSCAFAAGGRLLVTADLGGLRLWNVATARLNAAYPVGDTRSVLVDNTTGTLVTNGRLGVRRWPAPWQADPERFILGQAENLTWRPDYEPLISADQTGTWLAGVCQGRPCLFDLRTQSAVTNLAAEERCEFAALSPTARWCATGAYTNGVRIYEVSSQSLITNLPARTSHAVFSPDARWLAVPGYDEYSVWDTSNWRRVWNTPRRGTGYMIRGVVAFEDDSHLIALAQGPVVELRDTATGAELAALEAPEPANISAIAFTPSGDKLAVCKWNHTIDLWDLQQVRSQLAAMKLDWDLPPDPDF
jgi:WD40 repeat protein